MKHQLFKKNTYVQVDVGKSHLTIIGKVKDSTISKHVIKCNDMFCIPQQAIQLEPKLLVIQENPEIAPHFVNDPIFLPDMIEEYEGLSLVGNNLFAGVYNLVIPSKAYRELFYKLNQGAK